MNALAQRIQRVLDEGRVESARAWSLAAGLSSKYVSTFLDRAKTSDDANVRSDALAKLANAAHVNLDWLVKGEGGIEPLTRWTENDPRYPNLAKAIRMLGDDVSAETRAAAQTVALHSPSDLDVSTWIAWLEDTNRKLRRQAKTGEAPGRPLADDDDTPPAGR